MEAYEKILLKDLNRLEKLLQDCKDEEVMNSLNEDINKIHQCLNSSVSFPKIDNNDEMQEIRDNIITNKINHIPIRPAYLLRQTRTIDDKQVFEEFIEKDEFGLKQVYENPNTYIFYESDKVNSLKDSIYIKSLKKNYIRVGRMNKISDYSNLLHKLGHAKLNLINSSSADRIYTSNFSETYSNFVKLMFFDSFKEYDRNKDSFNLKYSFLDEFVVTVESLISKLNSYCNLKDYPKFKSSFDYNYKLLMSNLLAMYLYNLYINNPDECIRKLNVLVNNFGLLDDKELLKAMNIDPGNFKNLKIISEFIKNLSSEKSKTKQNKHIVKS